MQDIIREEETIERFRCVKCGWSSQHAPTVKEHVKTHKQPTCEHRNRWYTFMDDGDGEHKLRCQCKDCNLAIDVQLFTFDQTVLAKLFEDLGGESVLHKQTHQLMDKRKAWEKKQADFEKKYGRPMNENEIRIFASETP